MKKRTGLLLGILFLLSIFTSPLAVMPVAASGTVYIRANGSIEGTPYITSGDNVTYTLTGNIFDIIIVERDNIVIDGANYAVQGTGSGNGIDLSYRTNVTINNVHVTNFRNGIYLFSASNNTLSGNNASDCSYFGIFLNSSSYNTLTGNMVFNNLEGILLVSSSNNRLSDNTVSPNIFGISLSYASNNNVLIGNSVSNNVYGSISLESSRNNTLTGNTVSNNAATGISLQGSNNNTLTGNFVSSNRINGIYLSYSSNNKLAGNNASNNMEGAYPYPDHNDGDGIYLASASNNNILTGNTASNNNRFGIYLFSASNNTLSGNNASNGSYYGISLNSSSYNTLTGNIASNNQYGIGLYSSSNNTLTSNNASDNNSYGIQLDTYSNHNVLIDNIAFNNSGGIRLSYASNNTLSGNTVSSNSGAGILLTVANNNTLSGNTASSNGGDGIVLLSLSSIQNVFIGNTISNNSPHGIHLSSNNNVFFHNKLVNNTLQVYVSIGTVNTWDDGYPSGGNYWSDYTGADVYRGPYQNETGSDGIGDKPYIIDDSNQDRYPLLDTTPPTTVEDYDGLWHRADFTITLFSTDEGSGVKETYYKLNEGPTQTVSADGQPLITTEDADNILEYWSFDLVGNEELPHKILDDIKLDKTAPTANAGQNQTVVEDTEVTFDGTASTDDNGIVSYSWTFTDEVTPKTLTGVNPTYNFTTPGLYTLALNVTDVAGNWATDAVVITVLLDTDGDAIPDTTDTDDDGDGLPDTWEISHGLNPLDAADASLDPDGDGLVNLQEYEGSTDPNNYFSPFPLWIAGVVVFAVAGVAIFVYFVKKRKT